MNFDVDVKALIHLYVKDEIDEKNNIYARNTPVKSSVYRPHHRIHDNYLTTGVHYYSQSEINPGETVEGKIKFLAPCEYPNSLWIDKRIDIQEGYKVVGYAIIKDIYNKVLDKNE